MSTKRAWKLQEFVAHSSNVNCLALGHKSGRVMVTGGEDKKVNLWTVGKPNCLMSLSGHTSPVESVRFGNAEEMVVAGSMSGALKIWDLEAAKIVRTLTGHKSSIRSLEFHPFGEYVASGSLDTNIKLWDIRRKGCIFTYKGHTNCVNCLRFSPDGRWMVSAGEDGHLKMWDLTAGKVLTDFKGHSGAVTTCAFHPDEFLLASGSSDRTVKFWDLDSFQMISSTDGDSTPVRCVFFHSEGLCLYSGASDHLKIYGWEPVNCYDSISLGWGKVADIALAQNQLIGATYSATNVQTFVVDIQRCGPVAKVPNSPVFSPPATPSGRRSFASERPLTQSSKRASQVAEAPEEAITPSEDPSEEESTGVADIQDPQNYEEIFRPRSKLERSPTWKNNPFPAPPDEAPDDDFMPKPVQVQHKPAGRSSSASNQQRTPVSTSTSSMQQRTPVQSSSTTNQPRTAVSSSSSTQQKTPVSSKPASPPAKVTSSSHSNRPPPLQSQAPAAAPPPAYGDCNIDDFLPKKSVPQLGEGGQVPANMSDADAFSSITKGHGSMQAVLTSRQRNLQIVRAMWTAGNKTAIESAIGMHDQAVIVDLLNVFNQKPGLWSLDLCTTLLPQVKDLMGSKYENYILTGCTALKNVLRNFATVIKSNLEVPASIGVDISREERHQKCKSCYDVLISIRSSLDQKGRHQGKLGSKYREIQVLFNQLD